MRAPLKESRSAAIASGTLPDSDWGKFQALQDFQHALSALIFLSDMPATLDEAGVWRFRCYHDAAVIAYCRPFTQSKGLPTLSFKAIGVKPDAEELVLHKRVFDYRNKVVAHNGADWKANWALFDELVGQHDALGQKIDFAPLKKDIDQVFLFDMSHHLGSALQKSIEDGRLKARKIIESEFGSPVRDNAGHNARHTQLRGITFDTSDMYLRRHENLAQDLLDQAETAKAAFKRDFGIEIDYDEDVLRELAIVATWYGAQPLVVTAEMIGVAEDRKGE